MPPRRKPFGIQEEVPSSTNTTHGASVSKRSIHKNPFRVRGTSLKALTNLKKGPLDPAGTLIKLSDRSSLCMSTRGPEVAIGSSDHAIYLINVEKEKFVRTLYGKRWGHTEWVTCVQFLSDGRILSGGMDSKLCLWEKNVVRCVELLGHKASISGCTAILDSSLVVSSSYDKTLKIWDLVNTSPRKAPSCIGTLQGHNGAVTAFSLGSYHKRIMSGSRTGEVALWDGEESKRLMYCRDAHAGQVNVVHNMEGNKPHMKDDNAIELFLSGGQDGFIQVWDFGTQSTPVQSVRAFKQSPVSYLATSQSGNNDSAVVVAGDKTLKVLDPRASFQTIHTIHDHVESIFCLYVHEGGLIWSGAADGKLLAHEVASGECLYGLGAVAQGAVRCACLAQGNKLVVTGDDGNVLIYSH